MVSMPLLSRVHVRLSPSAPHSPLAIISSSEGSDTSSDASAPLLTLRGVEASETDSTASSSASTSIASSSSDSAGSLSTAISSTSQELSSSSAKAGSGSRDTIMAIANRAASIFFPIRIAHPPLKSAPSFGTLTAQRFLHRQYNGIVIL